MTLSYKPQNVAVVTKALVDQISEGVGIVNCTVDRADVLNEDTSITPWVGVYRDSVEYIIKTLGYGTGYRDAKIIFVVVVQESDPKSGADCEDRLEALIRNVIGAILADTTIRGSVAQCPDLTVRYADYRRVGSDFMQTAAIYLTAIAPVQVIDQ